MQYKPIPVDTARQIAADCNKDIIVILAYDHETETTHSTTWGRDPKDKEAAVDVRDICLESIGVTKDKTTYQDYRFIKEGERAQIVDELVAACRDLIMATDPLLNPPDDIHRIRKRAQQAIDKA